MIWVRKLISLILINIFLVFGVAASNGDLFANEEVGEDKGRDFAKELNATFKATSAYLNYGIQELFKEVGFKYLQKKYQINKITSKDKTDRKTLKLGDKSSKYKKEIRNQNCSNQ